VNTVHVLVLPDGTLKICREASTALLRHAEFNGTLHELQFEEDKIKPVVTQKFGPSTPAWKLEEPYASGT